MTQIRVLSPHILKAFESVPDLYLILSSDLHILTASEAYLAATLTTRQDIVGKNMFEVFPDNPNAPEADSVKNLRTTLQEVLATRKPHQMALQRYDVRRPPKSGGGFEEKYWNPVNTPVLDEQGNILYIIHKVSDAIEQVKTQQHIQELVSREQSALREAKWQQKKLYDLFMQAPALIATVQGPDYIFEMVNPLYQQLFSGRELLGKPLLEAVPEIKGNAIMDILNRVYQTGETFTGNEIPVPLDRSGNGTVETVYFNFIYQATRDIAGKVNGVITFAYDVTQNVLTRQALQKLNQELEDRVNMRTKELKMAQAEAETERNKLYHLLMQAPAMICLFKGPRHAFSFVNPPYQQLVGERPLLGKPIQAAMPELEGQPIFTLLDKVYQTGQTFYAHEMLVQLDHTNSGTLGENYYNFIYQATRDLQGDIDGILVFAYEVTGQVLARRQVEQSEKQLQILNRELAATNEELKSTNEELSGAKEALEQLNTKLEERVGVRTKELKLAQAEAEHQRQLLHNLFMEAPAPIVILDGPELVFHLVNPAYQKIFPGRALLGKPVLEALPELEGSPILGILNEVYQTGKTFVAQELPLMLARHQEGPLEELYFTFTYQARYNKQGKVDGVMAFAYEVTSQVNARKSIESSARQLRLITDALPVLIGYMDRDEKYRFTNQAYQAWFQQKPEELLGRPVREVLGEKAYQGVKGYIERALAGEQLDFEAKMPYRENFVKYIRTSYVPDIQEGNVIGFYTMVTDITEQVEARKKIEESEKEARVLARELAMANEELNNSVQQLSYINADLDNFIYTASHDLKAPIGNIEGLMKALLRQLPQESLREEKTSKTIAYIQESIERFKRTIANLTEVVKLQRKITTLLPV